MSICLSRYAIQESKKIPKIVHPLKTSSCGMFSRVGLGAKPPLGKIWRTPKGQRLESHTKTLMERVFPRNQLKPLAKMARGLGSGLKPLLMKKGLGLMEDGRGIPAL